MSSSESVEGGAAAGLEVEERLLELSKSAFDGVVETAHPAVGRTEIYFDEGFVAEIVVEGESPGEELGRMLDAAERLPGDELERAVDHADRRGRTLRESLYSLDILEIEDVRRAVKGRLSYLLHRLFDADLDAAEIERRAVGLNEVTEVPALRARLSVESIVFQRRIEHFKRLSVDERRGLIERHWEARPGVAADGADRLQRVGVAGERVSLAESLLDGRRRLPEVVTGSPLPPSESLAVVFALRSMDLVAFRTAEPSGARASRVTDEVEVKHLSVLKASYFEVLNLHWSSYDELVHRAHAREREQFDPDRAPERLDDAVAMKLREIAERIDRAHERLETREKRARYRSKMVPDHRIDKIVLQLDKRAELARDRGRDAIAGESWRRVLELRPDREAVRQRLEAL